MGQKSSEEFLLRVKREDETSNEIKNADKAEPSSGSADLVTGTTKPSSANLTSAVTIPKNNNNNPTSSLPEPGVNICPKIQNFALHGCQIFKTHPQRNGKIMWISLL